MRQLLRNILLLCVLNTICGQPRIRNGKKAKLGQFPYQAMLLIRGWQICGGSIIHKRWILTAAHCVNNPSYANDYSIAVGGIKRNAIDGTRYAIEAIVIHEKYSSEERYDGQYDIALVRLKNDIRFNKNVSPIKLPKNNTDQYENDLAVLSGWGRTQNDPVNSFLPKFLQFVFLRIVEKRKCVESWSVEDSHICTAIDDGKSACSGDSGGPLVVGDTQVGLVAFGDGICARSRPIVHTRVPYYVSWIKQQMQVYKDALPY